VMHSFASAGQPEVSFSPFPVLIQLKFQGDKWVTIIRTRFLFCGIADLATPWPLDALGNIFGPLLSRDDTRKLAKT
jgi:hypothetical protein